jgi:putative ABC transport system substrate-binding protein
VRRREFILAVGGTAAAWPVAARAQQQAGRFRGIGVLAPSGPQAPVYAKAFRDGLRALGWSDGQNIHVEYHWVHDDADRLKSEAANLVALAPDVIVGGGTQVTMALKERTQTIPIVFVHVLDPISSGLVESLARPGGNVTGFTAYESSIGGKWLELLKEMAPQVKHVLVLVGENPTWHVHVPTIQAAAPSFKAELTITHVSNAAAIAPAIGAFGGQSDSGMIVLPDNMLEEQREQVAALAAKHRIPAIYGTSTSLHSGGLLTYSSDWADIYRRAASYVDKLLKGAKPADLPIQQPTKFYLKINLKTAKALGLDVPPTLLARADEVIE